MQLKLDALDGHLKQAQAKGLRNLVGSNYDIEDYSIMHTTRDEPYMRALRNGLAGAGITVENSKGEWGPGQEEINVKYDEALAMAGDLVLLNPEWGAASTSSPAPPAA